MRLILIAILYITTLPVYCQTNKSFNKLKQFVLDIYPKNKSTIDITHSIDTVIKLRNGNYFVLVINELNGAANSESGTYDCYEISRPYQEFQIKHSILNNGDNTGGMGMVDLTYKLLYLDKENYIIIANKNFVHHGNYNLLTMIVDCKKKYLDILVTNDYSGITADASSSLSQIAKIEQNKGNFIKITFRAEKADYSKINPDQLELTEKTYQIISRDIDTDLECITRINLLKKISKPIN